MINEEIMQKRREMFEKWADGDHLDWLGNDYENPYVESAWNGYNAALDSLVIELPLSTKRAFHEYDLGYNAALDHCEEAIEKAGIKTK
jgi:hypothetical protein